MAILLIKCPHTGRPILTGIEIDPDSFANLPEVLSYMKCPECVEPCVVDAGSVVRGGSRGGCA
jgi:hypothetical protein